MADKGLMTLDEAAAYLGVAKITLRRWTRKGELPCVRIGKRGDRRFRREDLDAYIKRNASHRANIVAPNEKSAGKDKRAPKGTDA